uniref:Ground-like domain-containing protein n=1 Tax=Panagrolaimus davidi TaxID=227884 RepID=A0A914Q339_9BILA
MTIRKKRQQDYGRNPPSTQSSFEFQQPSPQSQPSQTFSSLQMRPSQTLQNNVASAVRNTVLSQQSQQPSTPPRTPAFRAQPSQNFNQNLPPSTSPRRQNGRRASQRQQPQPQQIPPQQDPVGSNNNGPLGGNNGPVKAARYYYPPRMPLPLPVCFYNPTGYVCCNKQLNDLIVDTYTELEARPKFHTCNINAIATMLQMKAESRFNTTFETIAGFEDFAQKIHFNGDLACKVEIGGKYMLAYGTVEDAEQHLPPEDSMGPQNEIPRHHISKRHSAFF